MTDTHPGTRLSDPGAATAMSMGEAFTYQARRDPHRVSIIGWDGQITRGELEARANRAAREFADRGVRHGDLVTIALPNGIDFYVATAASWKLGAVPQPVSYRLPDLERDAIIALADPSLVVGVAPERVIGRPALAPGWQPRPDTSDEPLPPAISPSWVALTSGGSTGRPKVIVNARPAVVDPTVPIVGMSIDGVQLVPGPLYHNGPFTFSVNGLFTGSTIVLMNHFEAATVLELVDRYRVDWMFAVPTMLRRIWQLPEDVRAKADLSSLRVLFSSGSPWPAWLKQEYVHWLGPDRLVEMYGGTEQYGSTVITGRESIDHPGSVGKPMGGAGVRILDPDTGAELAPGPDGIGEVYFMAPGGPGSTYRYLGAEAKSRDGWETLGDLGYLDQDGYLYLVDRRTDMVVSGGANIYPAEVEAALERHELIRSAAVIGLPDDDLGQRVHAIVDTGDAADELGDDRLKDHLREHLAPYKIPRTFEYVTEPLRDDAGKVRRSALRDARLTSVHPAKAPAKPLQNKEIP